MHLRSLLRPGDRSTDSESEDDREPDPPHGHSVGMAGRESSKPEQFSTLNRPETYLPPAPPSLSDWETIPAWRSRRWHQVCDGIAQRKHLEEFRRVARASATTPCSWGRI